MFVWGSQNARMVRAVASSALVRRVINILIIPFRGAPELADWKSDVLIDTKGTGASSVNRDV